MHKSQANRAVIRDRSIPSRPNNTGPVSRNLLARTQTTLPSVFGPGGRVSKVRYSGSGDKGYRSEWTRPVDFRTDSRWSQTVSNQSSTPVRQHRWTL